MKGVCILLGSLALAAAACLLVLWAAGGGR